MKKFEITKRSVLTSPSLVKFLTSKKPHTIRTFSNFKKNGRVTHDFFEHFDDYYNHQGKHSRKESTPCILKGLIDETEVILPLLACSIEYFVAGDQKDILCLDFGGILWLIPEKKCLVYLGPRKKNWGGILCRSAWKIQVTEN